MHRSIELLIGRLISDEQFRTDFQSQPQRTLAALREGGLALTRTEVAALLATDPGMWTQAAERLDPRLRKAGLPRQPAAP